MKESVDAGVRRAAAAQDIEESPALAKYLERLNSQKNEEAKKEEARQTEKPSTKPGMRKSKTTATAAMLEQKLNFGPTDMYMGKKKGQTEETPSAHRRKVDVFATPYNSKKKLGGLAKKKELSNRNV